MTIDKTQLTPMMQQYMEVKDQYPNDVLFFRMGDFFEMFLEDAHIASEVLEIALTYRNKNNDNPIPMAGVPHHAYKNYINRMTAAGYTVIICDQVEDAKEAKGLVRREITRIVTPGMVLDPDDLDARSNHYLASVFWNKEKTGIAFLDLSTGDFRTAECTEEEAISELLRLSPKEILLSEEQEIHTSTEKLRIQSNEIILKFRITRNFSLKVSQEKLCQLFETSTLDGFGLATFTTGIRSSGALVDYVLEAQKAQMPPLHKLVPYAIADYMVVDKTACINLELLETQRERSKKGSLLGVLDFSVTAMGGRKTKQWMLYPLLNKEKIEERLSWVQFFYSNHAVRADIREALKKIHDLERLNSKIATGVVVPRDLMRIKDSLEAVPFLNQLLQDSKAPDSLHPLLDLKEVAQEIGLTLVDEPPVQIKEGGLIRRGVHKELDELRDIAENGKDKILEIQENEKKETGIQSLKVRFNKVFGYYIEVTKPNLHLVPDHYIRKQTMVNHERYITPELKEFEEKVIGAEERILQIEEELFLQLRLKVLTYGADIADSAEQIAVLDVLSSFAELAVQRDYNCPEISEKKELEIVGGRHPVVETMLPSGRFVPNDLSMQNEQTQFILITGPNMAGKSTIMRQAALIVLMAQMGCFVPAQKAVIGLCDRVFTRVGASDNLAAGQSTFMVEMTETANILHNATSRSMVILDEIGRGTSTFDGLSIAWSVAEYLHNTVGCRTLFATHYHELMELENVLFSFRNMSVAVRETEGDVAFLHKLVEGGTNHSYGIQVAKLAGLPSRLVARSKKILLGLEQGKLPTHSELSSRKEKGGSGLHNQLSFFAPPSEPEPSALERELRELEINNLSPLEAMQLLYKWKETLNV